MSKFEFSSDNKRYHTLAFYFKRQGLRRFKASVNLGLDCPNRDGTKGTGGCIFCLGNSSYFSRSSDLSVTEQLKLESERIWKKNPGVELTAYLQSGSNTYTSCEKLESALEEAMSFKGVTALSIATRPDCIPPEMEELLFRYCQKIDLTVELGLQTAKDDTGELINRCYPYSVFESCFNRLKARKIPVCVHIINGLPSESREDMLNTARLVGELRPKGVKIHLLHVLRGTTLEKLDYTPMKFEDYVETVVGQLELLPAEIVIERLTGDGDKQTLLAPLWSRDKRRVLGTIDKIMAEKDTWQGRLAK